LKQRRDIGWIEPNTLSRTSEVCKWIGVNCVSIDDVISLFEVVVKRVLFCPIRELAINDLERQVTEYVVYLIAVAFAARFGARIEGAGLYLYIDRRGRGGNSDVCRECEKVLRAAGVAVVNIATPDTLQAV
jgi:hypothetical protein